MNKSAVAWIRTALAVVDVASPVRASRQLGVSIPTVYRHIDALEAELGLRVFDRAPGGWILREEAQPLLQAGRRIEDVLASVEIEMKDTAAKRPETLRIAVSDEFATHYVAPRLPAFIEAFQTARPELVVASTFADLAAGKADVAIRPHKEPGDILVGRRAGCLKHAFYAAPEFVSATQHTTNPPDFANQWFCGYGPELADYTAAQWMDANVADNCVVARFGSTLCLAAAVSEGMGIGLLPCYIGDRMSGLVCLGTVETGLPVDIWLVTAAVNRKQPKVQAFFRYFASAIRADEKLFRGMAK